MVNEHSAALCDFGLSSMDAATRTTNVEDQIGGRIAYQAPETLSYPPERKSFASDVFAFGSLCYEVRMCSKRKETIVLNVNDSEDLSRRSSPSWPKHATTTQYHARRYPQLHPDDTPASNNKSHRHARVYVGYSQEMLES